MKIFVFAGAMLILFMRHFLTGSNICHAAEGRVDETRQWIGQEEHGVDKSGGVICRGEVREG